MFAVVPEHHPELGDPSYGNQLIASFQFKGKTLYAQYAHLSKFLVKPGRVTGGMVLGLTGTTGNADSRAPHLHIEIRTVKDVRAGAHLKHRIDPVEIFGAHLISEHIERVERRSRTA